MHTYAWFSILQVLWRGVEYFCCVPTFAKINGTQALMCNVVKGQIHYHSIRTSTSKLQDTKSKSKKPKTLYS